MLGGVGELLVELVTVFEEGAVLDTVEGSGCGITGACAESFCATEGAGPELSAAVMACEKGEMAFAETRESADPADGPGSPS